MAKYPVDPEQYFNPDGEVWVENIKDVCPKLCHFQQVRELAWDLDWKLLMACEWGDFESVVDMVNTDIPICETYKGCHLLIDFIPYPEMLEWVLERGACYYINTVPNFQPWPRAFSPPDHLCALSRLILRRDSGRLILSRGSAEDKKREFISWKLKVVRILLKFGAALENPESVIQPLDAALNLVQDRNTESEGLQILQLMTSSFGAVADDHHVTRAWKIAASSRSGTASHVAILLQKTLGRKKPHTTRWRPTEVYHGCIRPQAYYPENESEGSEQWFEGDEPWH